MARHRPQRASVAVAKDNPHQYLDSAKDNVAIFPRSEGPQAAAIDPPLPESSAPRASATYWPDSLSRPPLASSAGFAHLPSIGDAGVGRSPLRVKKSDPACSPPLRRYNSRSVHFGSDDVLCAYHDFMILPRRDPRLPLRQACQNSTYHSLDNKLLCTVQSEDVGKKYEWTVRVIRRSMIFLKMLGEGSSKETLGPISELTGGAIAIWGQYHPPGKILGPGECKLYLFIEGPLENYVKKAKSDVKRMLEEFISHITHLGVASIGKYCVMRRTLS